MYGEEENPADTLKHFSKCTCYSISSMFKYSSDMA